LKQKNPARGPGCCGIQWEDSYDDDYEIAPDVFRICTFVPDFDLQFNQFVVRDEEPLLFHTGPRALFPDVRKAVSTLLDPARIRWIGFSHLEADERGTPARMANPRAELHGGLQPRRQTGEQ
jgi:flavorubredoxin